MRAVAFEELTSETKDRGQRIEVETTVSAACVSGLIEEFVELMSRVKGVHTRKCEDAANQLKHLLGEQEYNDACRDYVLNRATTAAVESLDVDIVLAPSVHAEVYPVAEKAYSFTINLTPCPKLSLSSYESVRVIRPRVVVEESDIDDQVSYAARQFAEAAAKGNKISDADVLVVDDAWVARNLPQFETLEGFRSHIRADLERQKDQVERQELIYRVRHALEQRLQGEIPDEMYQEAKESLARTTIDKLESQGKTLDEYLEEHEITQDAFNVNVFMQASEYLRQNLALDALAAEKGFQETEDDIRRVRADLPRSVSCLSDEEFVKRGFRKSLGEHIRREEAMKWLMDTAIIE